MSYYRDVAISAPSGCGCKWSATYCTYRSIQTVRGGRMCGNYNQLVVCIPSCYVASPAAPTNGYKKVVSNTNVQYGCNAGFYGPLVTKTCNGSLWSGPALPTCTICPPGSYCAGSTQTTPLPCLAGQFGSSPGLKSSACNGACSAGYYCPAGSSSSTQVQCGGTGSNYCPAKSAAPSTCPTPGYYTTPLTSPVYLRTSYLACPAMRACANGLILPGVDFGALCPILPVNLNEFTVTDFGSNIRPSAPGCLQCNLTYNVTIEPTDPTTCIASRVARSIAFNNATGLLRAVYNNISYADCAAGFTVILTAARTDPTGLAGTCRVPVAVQQVARPPTIVSCSAKAIAEKSPVSSIVFTNISAVTTNTGMTLLWSIVNGTGVPFSISGCDAVVRITKLFTWRQNAWWNLTLAVTSLGLNPTTNATCLLSIPVTRVLMPPLIREDTLMVPEASRAGFFVGNIGPYSQDDGTSIESVWFAQNDTRNAFVIDKFGNVTVGPTQLAVMIVQSTYRYNVSVRTTGGYVASYILLIALTAVPLPPQTVDQVRTVSESVLPGYQLLPALSAYHPQNLAFNFTDLQPPSEFGITRTGIVYLLPNNTLDFATQSEYVLTFYLQDANMLVSSGTVTITVTELSRPPTWGAANYSMLIDEYALPGTVGYTWANVSDDNGTYSLLQDDVELSATPYNPATLVTYALLNTNPPGYFGYISVDPQGGTVSLSASPPGPFTYNRAWSFPVPETIVVNVSATAWGVPPMSSYTTVYVRISEIWPRIIVPTMAPSVPSSAVAGTPLFNVSVWTPYGAAARLRFNITVNDKDANGVDAFQVSYMTGLVSLRSPMPVFNYNVKNTFLISVLVTDTYGNNDTQVLRINLQHFNQRPSWRPVPLIYAPSLTPGNIGSPLNAYVSDPDVILGVGEYFRFSLPNNASGNPTGDWLFAVNNATGQLYINNTQSPSFRYPANGPAPRFNITVVVADAGLDGPVYTASTVVTVELTVNTIPPGIWYHNLSVPELVPAGTVVGTVYGSSINMYNLTFALQGDGQFAYLPFPFAITAVQAPVINAGRITTTAATPLDFNEGFRTYRAIVTVTDTNPLTPLSNSTVIDINVLWVPRPPFFDRVGRVPNSTVYSLSIKELSPAFINVTDTQLLASSKDPWQRPLLKYRIVGGNPYVALDPDTAVLSTKASFPTAVDFLVIKWINITIEAKDSMGLTDYASVTIRIEEINKPAAFDGLLDASSRPVTSLAVREDAPASTTIGYVLTSDPNEYVLWRARTHSILPVGDGAMGFFGINAATGAVYVQPGVDLDWWDQSTFHLVVTVRDSDPFAPIVVNTTIRIDLIQINRVAITDMYVDALAPVTSAVNTTGPGAQRVAFTTHGFAQQWLYISGTGFGRTLRRLTLEGRNASFTRVTAKFGPFAAACQVVAPNTLIACSVPEGAGAGHAWNVTIDNAWWATTGAWSSYFPPTITSVYRVGGNPGDASTQAMDTRGTDALLITGDNVGPSGSIVYLAYGRQALGVYESAAGSLARCTWITSQSVVRCPTAPGVGTNLRFALQVEYQSSADFTASPVRYKTPTIANVTAPTLFTNGTQPGQLVVFGDQFGPTSVRAMDIVVTYSKNFSDPFYTVFTATACAVTAAHSRIVCDPVPGVGTNLSVRVSIATQTSASSGNKIGYIKPIITALGGVGQYDALTIGGQEIVLSGQAFGPLTQINPDGTPIANDLQPVATYRNDRASFTAVNCRVTTADKTITCDTAPGYGKDLRWSTIVGEQSSPIFMGAASDYTPPVVAQYFPVNGSVVNRLATPGHEFIEIQGTNYGPMGTPIDRVTYGNDANSSDFLATHCFMFVPHTSIVCETVEGAGSRLRWLVTIGDQASVVPTTSYAPPLILNFTGPYADDASTDGGDYVLVNGQSLSTQRYLDTVTFGPSGTEFTPKCFVSIPHEQLNCTLPPGIGRGLKWYVSVGRQVSAASIATTSYALPQILSFSPMNASTEARSAGSDVILAIEGQDLALRVIGVQCLIKINNNGIPAPPDADIETHWAAARAGGIGLSNVATWISQLTTLYPTQMQILARSRHRVFARLPPGYGSRVPMFALVGGVPSNITYFSYTPPRLVNIAPDRQNVSSGFLRVFIEGSSFCDGLNGCGTVLLNNQTVPAISWTHTTVLIVAPDPSQNAQPSSVQIFVDGIGSNIMYFKKPVANIDALVAQGVWNNMDTRGGQTFYVRGVLDIVGANASVAIKIGESTCTDQWGFVDNGKSEYDPDASYTLVCRTPEGVGQNLPITLVFQNSTSAQSGSLVFSYAAPALTSVRIVAPFYDNVTAAAALDTSYAMSMLTGYDMSWATPAQAGIPTLGALVIVNGTNLGRAYLGAATVEDPLGRLLPTVVHQDHTYALLVIPPGDGQAHSLRYSIAQQISNALPFVFAAPTVLQVLPNHGPTAGGTVLTIIGRNFGVSVPSVTIGRRNCSLVNADPWVPSGNHSIIQCVLPPGQGTNLAVTVVVNGVTSTTPAVLFRYDPPEVLTVIPDHGPTSGRLPGPFQVDGVHRLPGPRVMQTLTGRNFGQYGRVSYLPIAGSDPLARNFTVANQDILLWNDTMIVYYMPEGMGYGLHVDVYADQDSVSTLTFSYDLPVVEAVVRFDRPIAACRSIEQCFSVGNITRCRTVAPGCYPTRGGFPVEVVGENFGLQSLIRTYTQVWIGGKPCIVASDPVSIPAMNHERVICSMPTGLGEDLPVTMQLGTRSSALTNFSTFSYDPPMIVSLQSSSPDATGNGGPLYIRGANFGYEASNLAITINDEPCVTAEWLNDGQLKCQIPPEVVGAKNLSILVANRTTPYTYWDVEEALVYQCTKDYYGMEGEACLDCPQGASCPGAERLVDLVNATDGFWRFNYSSADDPDAILFCDPPRRDTREFCPAFLPCGPPEACLAGNICAEGYEGDRCAFCLKGQYYRQNDLCVKCPNNMAVLYAGLAVLLILLIVFAWFLNSRNINLAIIAIGVDYAQVVSMFARTKIRWPKLLRQLFQVLSAFNLNIEITAPECLNPEITFYQKWFLVESLPLAIAVLMFTLFGLLFFLKSAILNVPRKLRAKHWMPLLSSFIVLYRVAFLTLTRTSFDVLNCTPTDPPVFRDTVNKKSPIEYMSGLVQPEYECWAKGSWQVFLFPFGVATLICYTFAVPGLALYQLNRNKDTILLDQVLRARGMGDSALDNPRFDFRRTWQKLYYHYLPEKWYWEFCITARKIFIAGITLAFRQVPSYQLAIALLVLFTAYVLHVLHWPYMSHTNRHTVIPGHEAKVLYDDLHARIDAEIKAHHSKNIKARRKVDVFGSRAAAKDIFPNRILLTIFDANTVESVLLGCAVLVSLAGIMLDSKRFDGDNWYIPQVQHEFTGLTYGALLLIVLSLIYYAWVFTVEMCLAFCPGFVPQMMGICCRKKVIEDAKRSEAMARKSSVMALVGGQSDTSINPLLVNKAPPASDQAAAAVRMTDDGIIDVHEINGNELPNAALWAAMKRSHAKLLTAVEDLRGQLRESNIEVKGSVADNPMRRAPSIRTRTNFSPSTVADTTAAPIRRPPPGGAQASLIAGMGLARKPSFKAPNKRTATTRVISREGSMEDVTAAPAMAMPVSSRAVPITAPQVRDGPAAVPERFMTGRTDLSSDTAPITRSHEDPPRGNGMMPTNETAEPPSAHVNPLASATNAAVAHDEKSDAEAAGTALTPSTMHDDGTAGANRSEPADLPAVFYNPLAAVPAEADTQTTVSPLHASLEGNEDASIRSSASEQPAAAVFHNPLASLGVEPGVASSTVAPPSTSDWPELPPQASDLSPFEHSAPAGNVLVAADTSFAASVKVAAGLLIPAAQGTPAANAEPQHHEAFTGHDSSHSTNEATADAPTGASASFSDASGTAAHLAAANTGAGVPAEPATDVSPSVTL